MARRRQQPETFEQREARRIAERDASIARQLGEFKTLVQRAQADTVLHTKDWFKAKESPVQLVLANMVYEFTYATECLKKALEGLAAEMNEAVARLETDNWLDPIWHSSGVTRGGGEVDVHREKRKVLGEQIARLSHAIGYYVPDIHTTHEQALHETMRRCSVLPQLDGTKVVGWLVQRLAEDGTVKFFHGLDATEQEAPVFSTFDMAIHYDNEDAAWQGLHEVCYGRKIEY